MPFGYVFRVSYTTKVPSLAKGCLEASKRSLPLAVGGKVGPLPKVGLGLPLALSSGILSPFTNR